MEIQFSKSLSQVKLALVDTAVKANQRRLTNFNDISCRSGCAGCCSRLVEITMAEAVLIYQHLQDTKQWDSVRTMARSQAAVAKTIAPLVWFKMNRKCCVLDTEKSTCRAYAVRPAWCSIHFVSSPPECCSPWSSTQGLYIPTDFLDLFTEFRKRMASHVEGYGILSLELPLPIALLLAERINTMSGLSVDQAVSLMFNEL
jgi:hypothetical protein